MGVYKDLKARNEELEKQVRDLSAANTDLTIKLDRERSNNDAYRIARKDDKLRIEALEIMLNKRQAAPPLEHELIPLQCIRVANGSIQSNSIKKNINPSKEMREFERDLMEIINLLK